MICSLYETFKKQTPLSVVFILDVHFGELLFSSLFQCFNYGE